MVRFALVSESGHVQCAIEILICEGGKSVPVLGGLSKMRMSPHDLHDFDLRPYHYRALLSVHN